MECSILKFHHVCWVVHSYTDQNEYFYNAYNYEHFSLARHKSVESVLPQGGTYKHSFLFP